MEQRIVSVLFYGVMGLAVATCVAELRPLWDSMNPAWVEAVGSWVGGAGSFTAAAVALWVASAERRSRQVAERQRDRRYQTVVATKLLIAASDISNFVSNTIVELESGLIDELERLGKYEEVRIMFLGRMTILDIDFLNELPYVDPFSIQVIDLDRIMKKYFSTLDLMGSSLNANRHHAFLMLRGQIYDLRQSSVLVSKIMKDLVEGRTF